jgi:two-component system, cell cycle response regulator DivK
MNARILIIDDNRASLELASYLLESAGYVVEKAANAEHAQELLKQVTPDLILMDLALPGMDGLTLTRKLKADERLKSVPVAAFTASAMMGDEQNALQAGCDGYVTKPIDINQFTRQVAAFLQHR